MLLNHMVTAVLGLLERSGAENWAKGCAKLVRRDTQVRHCATLVCQSMEVSPK